MKILWLTWKDMQHPQAGGAEVVNEELAKRAVADGHEVAFLTASYAGAEPTSMRNGFTIHRMGSRYTAYWRAYKFYKNNCVGKYDIVIDEMNTIPFFASWYVREPVVMFVHQLCREIWFYQMPRPVSWIGYIAEPLYLWLLRKNKVITVSQSTKDDLCRFGFNSKNISIISEGIDLVPIANLGSIEKYQQPTILALGAVRPMKRTLETVRAFAYVKKEIPNAQLVIAGDMSGVYGEQVAREVAASLFVNDIAILGRISKEKKVEVLQRSHIITVTSVKEGWGLVVTEANSQGTPAVVYNVDGLRDSVRDGVTGSVTIQNKPELLAQAIVILLKDKDKYEQRRSAAHAWSKEITFDRSYTDFKKILAQNI